MKNCDFAEKTKLKYYKSEFLFGTCSNIKVNLTKSLISQSTRSSDGDGCGCSSCERGPRVANFSIGWMTPKSPMRAAKATRTVCHTHAQRKRERERENYTHTHTHTQTGNRWPQGVVERERGRDGGRLSTYARPKKDTKVKDAALASSGPLKSCSTVLLRVPSPCTPTTILRSSHSVLSSWFSGSEVNFKKQFSGMT